ncbi:MAG: hypothetical protein LBO79_02930 [Zoogloeaceae bacterium]|jgi:hypothetical protein|nr:hypothetical protein [Zoogloeaceae bacterium]
MPADNPQNLAALHAAILSGLSAKLPQGICVQAYPDLRGREARVTLPAVLLELSELEPGEEPGTGEVPLIGRFHAFAVIDPNLPDACMQVRELAAKIAVALHDENWGLPITPARLVMAGEDGFRPELDGYLSWMVEWTQEFHLGALEWPYPVSPREVFLGLYPETGTGNEADYWPLGEAPPDDWGESA